MDKKRFKSNLRWIVSFLLLGSILSFNGAFLVFLSHVSLVNIGDDVVGGFFMFWVILQFFNIMIWFLMYIKLFRKDWEKKLWGDE